MTNKYFQILTANQIVSAINGGQQFSPILNLTLQEQFVYSQGEQDKPQQEQENEKEKQDENQIQTDQKNVEKKEKINKEPPTEKIEKTQKTEDLPTEEVEKAQKAEDLPTEEVEKTQKTEDLPTEEVEKTSDTKDSTPIEEMKAEEVSEHDNNIIDENMFEGTEESGKIESTDAEVIEDIDLGFTDLSQVKKVIPLAELDLKGSYKYILIKMTMEGGGDGAQKVQMFVRGNATHEYHKDLFQHFKNEVFEKLENATLQDGDSEKKFLENVKIECLGGGRIDADTFTDLHIYGESSTYGAADHKLTMDFLSIAKPDLSVTYEYD